MWRILVLALGSSAGYPGAPPPGYGFQSDYSSGRPHYPRQHNATPGAGGGGFWTGLGTGGALGYLFGSQRLVEGCRRESNLIGFYYLLLEKVGWWGFLYFSRKPVYGILRTFYHTCQTHNFSKFGEDLRISEYILIKLCHKSMWLNGRIHGSKG